MLIENPKNSEEMVSEGKTIAIISYLTFLGLIVAFVLNIDKKNTFASYHIRQSLGIGFTGIAISMFNIVPILGWALSIIGFFVLFVLWLMGFLSALNGKKRPVFLLGEKYQEWLKNI